MKLELVYDADCPHTELARKNLARALREGGFGGAWVEWERAEESAPAYARAYSSPSILYDGVDLFGEGAQDGSGACRLYHLEDGTRSGAPSADQILAALKRRKGSSE